MRISQDYLRCRFVAGRRDHGDRYGHCREYLGVLVEHIAAVDHRKVFDDVNYGGGSGRDFATANSSAVSSGFASGAIGRSGATVELYDASGNYVTSTTTDSTGSYTFNVGAGFDYNVRVVNSTVTSVRGGSGLIGVQTYQTSVSGTTTTAVTDRVGGDTPSEV